MSFKLCSQCVCVGEGGKVPGELPQWHTLHATREIICVEMTSGYAQTLPNPYSR